MARSGPRKVARYGDRFKATAVKLSGLPGALIQDVARALDIHPFMLSLWRKQVREGPSLSWSHTFVWLLLRLPDTMAAWPKPASTGSRRRIRKTSRNMGFPSP